MKLNPTEAGTADDRRLLILSDGKPGHVNQSIAFARHLGWQYDLLRVAFKRRVFKGLSYAADRLGIHAPALFTADVPAKKYVAVVSAGSDTYYANRTLAEQLGCKAVAIMLPKGYRLGFDLIVAQQHDDPPRRDTIIRVPINLTYVEPTGLVLPQPGHRYVALVIGGDSAHGKLDAGHLEKQISRVFELFPEHKVWMTTSRRTPTGVENMLRRYRFEQAVYYSQNPVNPIPDYLQHSEYVFLTADSSSMISEAVSFGHSCVEVLPLAERWPENSKFSKLLTALAEAQCLHVFDGSCAACRTKISLAEILNSSVTRLVKAEL